MKLRAACVQISAGADWRKNFEASRRLFHKALLCRPSWIAFPEMFYWRGYTKDMEQAAGEARLFFLKNFKALARKHRVHLFLGSFLEPAGSKDKYHNTSYVITPEGRTGAVYRKIHLFDIGLAKVKMQESKNIVPGREAVVRRAGKIRCGLSICYDLRFPELYRDLARRGAQALFVPANFTYETGKAHWELLLRARAVENQAFVLAAGQSGWHPQTGIQSFGTSLIIDPWGRVLARALDRGEGVIWADLDFEVQARLRKSFPVLSHRRL